MKNTTTVPNGQDAIAQLVADHQKVTGMFKAFEKLRSDADKAELAEEICKELTVHMQLEEEIFYPAVQAALHDHELVPEANVEHGSVKDLIAQLEGARAGGDEYDAKVHVMGELIEHHVKEEETEMFPKAKKAGLDLVALGARMAERRQELMAAA
ncbi:hemerythrin domain-containing protein [Ramlibacter sp.]|uniref:hemerythrin domain-containing protein n=1 Tax=Ramlibacter sp. TaxID=1917967 RepID=UPI002B81FC8F|nr:hemerythrin domain-containing protein [Ramlibacter sp.]HWI81998.1 hemerythrin domain-containing protein [Ramlibacter sp.]